MEHSSAAKYGNIYPHSAREQGLKSIRHARRRLVEALETAIRELGALDVPEGLMVESICEAYWCIQMKLPGLVESLVKADINR